MNLELIVTLYTSLFGIAVTIFGISVAGLIAFTQILQPILTHSRTQSLLSNAWIKWTGLSITLCIGLMLTAILTLAFPHNLFPANLSSQAIVSSAVYMVVTVLIMILSIALVVFSFYKEASLLVPKNALSFMRSRIKDKDVKKYFSYKGAIAPMPPYVLAKIVLVGDDGKEEAINDPEIEYAEKQAEYKKELAAYERDKNEGENIENPLVLLESFLLMCLKNGDLEGFKKSINELELLIVSHASKPSSDKYLGAMVKYYCDIIQRISEEAHSQNTLSYLSGAIESTHQLASSLVEKKSYSTANHIQSMWKEIADSSMGVSSSIFIQIMDAYRDAGEQLIKDKSFDENKDNTLLDNIHRSLGWLGERYLEKFKPERKAIMNNDYQTEFDALMNAVLSFGWQYGQHQPGAYPLIHFDSLYVIGKKLIKLYQPEDGEDLYAHSLESSLFSLMYEHESFADNAALNKNIDGCMLSLRGLEDFLRIFERNTKADELHTQTLDAVLCVGAAAAHSDIITKKDSHLYTTIQKRVIDILNEHSNGKNLSPQAREVLIKSHGSYKKVRAYLRAVEVGTRANFGMKLGDS